jgi:hypothetical protein
MISGCPVNTANAASDSNVLELLPYPQALELQGGSLPLGPPTFQSDRKPTETEQIALRSLASYLPREGKALMVRLGSVEKGYPQGWLTEDQRSFLSDAKSSPEASVLIIKPDGITIVGKGKFGMLYGAQTVNQLAIQAAREKRGSIPCLTIRDWPDAKWRCLSPQLAWYSGWGNRFEGYDNGNWTLDEWKWMVDWSLLHKCNAWAVCMYGLWPFTLPGYEHDTLEFDSFYYDMKTGKKTPYHYAHRNIKKEFLPELIGYANARGIQVHAYIGKNTFNGMYIKHHPEADAKSLVREAIPFTPGVHEYWDAVIKRILESGFNGFVFEDPETYHVPNQNEMCYKTFWAPWAAKYGFHSAAETNKDKPPLGVHVEYYTWLFREFDQLIHKHTTKLGRPEPTIYLISHILLNRITKESKDEAERAYWFSMIDEKHGRKVPYVLFEDDEKDYVRLLGGDRAATLGGRGGAAAGCFRISNINNDRTHGDLGMDLVEEREKQRRMIEAGGYGSMAYIFQWTNTEVFGYLGAQYLWRHGGVPSINNEDTTGAGFLDYAYRIYYGDQVGALAARAYGMNPCVFERNVLEDRPGIIFFGGPLHRDFQLLAVMADESDRLAQEAFKLYTGREPDHYHAAYDPDSFRWNGYDAAADKLFKTERLRQLCVSARRAQELCTAALASRRAKQRIAEGAPAAVAVEQFDLAVSAARSSELLYYANYDDDYGTGLESARLRESLEALRTKFLTDCGILDEVKVDRNKPIPDAVRKVTKRRVVIDWEKQTEILPEKPRADKPGLYLSLDVGLSKNMDFFCLGAVFTVQAQGKDGVWQPIFRRALFKKDTGWQHWDVPLDKVVDEAGAVKLRLITDAYSRAIDRKGPTWKWGYWGQPRLVEVGAGGKRNVRYDLIDHIERAKAWVQLDSTGMLREFDGKGSDSSGASFTRAASVNEMPERAQPAIAAFTPHADGASGVTISEYVIPKLR